MENHLVLVLAKKLVNELGLELVTKRVLVLVNLLETPCLMSEHLLETMLALLLVSFHIFQYIDIQLHRSK